MRHTPPIGSPIEVCGICATFLMASPELGADAVRFTVRATPGNAKLIQARCASMGAWCVPVSDDILEVASKACLWPRGTLQADLDDESLDIIYGGALADDAARVAVRFQRQLVRRHRLWA